MLATDLGQLKVTSIDFEKAVVQKMSDKKVLGVDYQVMDMLKMDFEDNSFDIVLDKGSFDALCCDKTEETREKTLQYLNEVCRVLAARPADSADGACHFTIVSLLQDFVFAQLLSYFVEGKANPFKDKYQFTLNLHMIKNIIKLGEGKKFIPFLVQVVKTERKEGEEYKKDIYLYSSPDTKEPDQLNLFSAIRRVKNVQTEAMVDSTIRVFRPGMSVTMTSETTLNGIPKYTLLIIDSAEKNIAKK